jgi:hypothetical protein
METDRLVIRDCLEEVAETDTDLAPAIYARLSRQVPEIDQHIDYLDERMRGRMLDQVYQLLLGELDRDYLAFETRMHEGYGATPEMYRGLLEAVKEEVRHILGQRWSDSRDAAWNCTIDRIVVELTQ